MSRSPHEPITNPESLSVGDELVYVGADMDWHYAEVIAVEQDSIVVDTVQGKKRASFASLVKPEYWRHK